MAILLEIFSLYKLILPDDSIDYLLLRTEKPGYSNADQGQEEIANQIEAEKRRLILDLYINNHVRAIQIEFLGELQEIPIGDELLSDKGQFRLSVFYQQTEYGFPWIILGCAENRDAFKKELQDDSDLLSLRPTGAIKQIDATFITENDFDLSAIKNYITKDVRDL